MRNKKTFYKIQRDRNNCAKKNKNKFDDDEKEEDNDIYMGYLEAKKYPIKNGISMVKALIYEFKKQTNNLAKNKVFPLVGKVSNTLLSFAKYKSFVTLDKVAKNEKKSRMLIKIEGTASGTKGIKEKMFKRMHI